ncbi:MAG: hypothetical protein FWF90_15030, partial [Promicromonosporaceae bacterium]|nr:hypothetical protein [Promicromonosporaceae bacterium]
WAWLKAQIESGADTITLPVMPGEVPYIIACDPDDAIALSGQLTIIGNGNTLSDLHIQSGTVFFHNVLLTGMQGLADEDGGAALTLEGDGACAVLSDGTRAVGGHSGPEGERGGDGGRPRPAARADHGDQRCLLHAPTLGAGPDL